MKKNIFSFLACCLLTMGLNAQDVLVMKNGEVKDVHIIEIGDDFIFYCLRKEEGAPISKINKKEIFTIKRSNEKQSISVQENNLRKVTEESYNKSNSTKDFVSIKFSYVPMILKSPIEDVDAKGFSIVAIENFCLLKQVPLYLGIGTGIQYTGIEFPEFITLKREYKTEYGKTTQNTVVSSMHFASLRFPISIGYKWDLEPDLNLSIFSHVGLNMRWNFAGWIGHYSPFDKTEMRAVGLKVWDKFQTGYNIGCDLMLKHISVGLSYSKDFDKIDQESKISAFYVNFGYNF